jgi:hypothetical protein
MLKFNPSRAWEGDDCETKVTEKDFFSHLCVCRSMYIVSVNIPGRGPLKRVCAIALNSYWGRLNLSVQHFMIE